MQLRIEDRVSYHLSNPRLAPYTAEAGTTTGAIKLYRWNLELSGALHEALGVVEVVLRNAIDRELQIWNTSRPTLPGNAPYGTNWVEHPARPLEGILNPRGRGSQPKSTYDSAFDRARADSNFRDPSHPRHGASPNHDDIVAHITFGTWVKLLPNRRDRQGQIGPGPQRGLWNNALRHSFPHQSDPLVIARWVTRLHRLRNRIAHVEPLLGTDVISYHRSAARLLRAVDPAVGGSRRLVFRHQQSPGGSQTASTVINQSKQDTLTFPLRTCCHTGVAARWCNQERTPNKRAR